MCYTKKVRQSAQTLTGFHSGFFSSLEKKNSFMCQSAISYFKTAVHVSEI